MYSSALPSLPRLAGGLAALCLAALWACGGPAPDYTAHDPALRRLPLDFFPSRNAIGRARGFVFFFGNDVGFWKPHRELAAALATDGYAVVGLDLRDMLAALPDAEPARDSAFVARIVPLIGASQRELHAESLPLLLAGHSFGAEIAIWTAAHADLHNLVGVLALSPGSRGHLRISLGDITNTAEPTDAESFAVADAVRALPPDVRLAIIRGANDKLRFADSALLAAGGARSETYIVPLAGHSLRNIILARYVIARALDWLLGARSVRPLALAAKVCYSVGVNFPSTPACPCRIHEWFLASWLSSR